MNIDTTYLKHTIIIKNSLFFSPTDPNEIDRIIKSLKSKKSSGPDKISSFFFKQIGPSIAYPLSIIINKSLVNGVIPDNLKLAKIIPIYKAKERDQFTNYRPVSLLSSFSKHLEKVVLKRTNSFVQINNLFYKSQYGFRQNRSTINAISEFINYTSESLDKKESTLSVFLDLSKAFDTIDHNILLKKLEFYGIRGTPLKWFENYLQNRTQYVQYQHKASSQDKMKCGVPQ
jgi:hypothetical protein